jgi:hypothetical protein
VFTVTQSELLYTPQKDKRGKEFTVKITKSIYPNLSSFYTLKKLRQKAAKIKR